MNWRVTDKLLFRYFEKQATESECRSISEWLKENSKNKQLFTTLKKLYLETEIAETSENIGQDAFEKFSKRVHVSESVERMEGVKKFALYRRKILRYAAVAIIVLSLAAGAFLVGANSLIAKEKSYCIVEAPYGGKSNIILPDGSKVWLNAGSKLSYSRNFSSRNRSVKLEGEAFFDIEKSRVPFIVETSHFDIHVLGTAFNVKSYPDEDQIETTLVEGAIRIEREELAQPLHLKPKEKLTFHKNSKNTTISKIALQNTEEEETAVEVVEPKDEISISRIEILEGVSTEEEISWIDGNLIFNKEPLGELAKKLERKYNIQFVFANEDVKTYSYSGTLRDFPLEQVLKAVELTSPVRYTIEGNKVTLSILSM